jgi:hypothetical protein|tara:strand:- start:81 stop:284 length:204 start_codon:yes stop_codon:yes gene_type:complete
MQNRDGLPLFGMETTGSALSGESPNTGTEAGSKDIMILEELKLIRQFLQTIDANIEAINTNGITVAF